MINGQYTLPILINFYPIYISQSLSLPFLQFLSINLSSSICLHHPDPLPTLVCLHHSPDPLPTSPNLYLFPFFNFFLSISLPLSASITQIHSPLSSASITPQIHSPLSTASISHLLSTIRPLPPPTSPTTLPDLHQQLCRIFAFWMMKPYMFPGRFLARLPHRSPRSGLLSSPLS